MTKAEEMVKTKEFDCEICDERLEWPCYLDCVDACERHLKSIEKQKEEF